MLSKKDSKADIGAALFLMFSPQQRAAMYDAVHTRGASLELDLIDAARQSGLSRAPLEFINTSYLGADDVISLVVGVKAIIRDALLANWTTDQYTLAITRAVKVPSDLASSIAKSIVTEDTEMWGLANTLSGYLPEIPLIPFDDVARGALKIAPSIIKALIPKDALNKSVDSAFEWLQLGEALRRMMKREALTNSEEAFEKGIDEAVTANPSLAPSLLSLASSLVHLPGAIEKRLESGDVESSELGELVGDYLSGLSVVSAHPSEQGDLLDSPEVGSLFGKIARTVGKIGGGLAGAMIGAPGLGASLGGSIGGGIGKIGQHHRRPASAGTQLAQLKKLADSKGYNTSNMNLTQVADLFRSFAG